MMSQYRPVMILASMNALIRRTYKGLGPHKNSHFVTVCAASLGLCSETCYVLWAVARVKAKCFFGSSRYPGQNFFDATGRRGTTFYHWIWNNISMPI